MKVPLRWLEEFIDLPTTDPKALADALDMVGEKVEGYEVLEAGWSDVVVGEVIEIAPHPDADKIRVCQVDTGDGPEQIICGAWNFEEGALVAVARPGAVLPGDFEIGRRTIRGVESNGMICSESELRLGEDHSGILVLDGDPALGTDFSDLVELPDVVFDLEITTNRPDAMSILGIARDLAAYFDISHRVPERKLTTVPGEARIEVAIGDPQGCRRFTAREIRGVKVAKSPLWVRHRLTKAGIRPISNVVDSTNYVMVELGQPLHAFDAGKIAGNTLAIHPAKEGESLVTLDGETRRLGPDDLIIYDLEGPTSMSGTMGGLRSEVSEDTVDVLMEAASWDPPTIMHMARRHGLRSEASTRFERGVDPNLTRQAADRASALTVEWAGGSVVDGMIDVVATRIDPITVELPLSEVARILGPGFDRLEVGSTLQRLGMSVDGEDPLTVTVPTFRPDVYRPADLIEEVARIHGYDKFASTLPLGSAGRLTEEQRRARMLRDCLTGIGLSQAVTLPFIGPDDLANLGRADEADRLVRVTNPLREEEGRLRTTLLPSLLASLRHNLSRGATSAALFETGRVFLPIASPEDGRLPHQPLRLAWAVVGALGPRQLGSAGLEADAAVSLGILRSLARALDLSGLSVTRDQLPGLHPGRSARVSVDGEEIGMAGELSPASGAALDLPGRVAVAELDLEPLVRAVPRRQSRPPSTYPPVDFDLSFVLTEGIPAADLIAATTGAASDLIEDAFVFDEFRGGNLGEEERAVAITYRLRATDRTLTNEEVAPVRDAMIEAGEALGARLRGAP